jgi:hypothetical protein
LLVCLPIGYQNPSHKVCESLFTHPFQLLSQNRLF